MDFSLRSFAQAFESAKDDSKYRKFYLYAFILATPADGSVFPELLSYLQELHHLTGKEVLIISPRIEMHKSAGVPMDALEIARVLATGRFFNHYSRQSVDVSNIVEKFLNDQTNQTYRFARFLNLDIRDIPCIVFFDTLESPDKYIHWSIEDTSATEVIRDFREILSLVQRKLREDKDPDMLKSIGFLDRKRFALRILRKVGEIAPDWIGLFKP